MKSYKGFLSTLSEDERMARSDFKVSPSGRKSHKEIVFKDGSDDGKDKDLQREELKGMQHKLDKNKNGKLDKQDFKLLRKEETTGEFVEITEAVKTTHEDPLVTVHDKHGLHTHANLSVANSIFGTKVKHTDVHAGETYAKNREGKPLKFALSQHHASAMKEEVEQIDEISTAKMGHAGKTTIKHIKNPTVTQRMAAHDVKPGIKGYRDRIDLLKAAKAQGNLKEEEMDEAFVNGREYASHGLMHPDHAKMDIHKVSGRHVDFYASKTGDKMHGKVVKNDGKSVHIQAHKELGDGKLHKFKVTPHLPKQQNEEVELDEAVDPSEVAGNPRMYGADTVKKAYYHKNASASDKETLARHLDRHHGNKEWRKPVKEDLDEAVMTGNEGRGYHGEHPSETANKKYSAAHATVKKVAGEAGHMKDVKKPNEMVKHYLDSQHGRHLVGRENDHEYIKKDFGKFKKNYKPEMHEGVGFDDEGNLMAEKKTYAQFMEQLLEYTPGAGGVTRVQGRSYGAQYHDPEGDDDADEKPKKPKADPNAPKRGRGRPAGAKSGANQKVTSGKSYGGIATHSLHLPNTNR